MVVPRSARSTVSTVNSPSAADSQRTPSAAGRAGAARQHLDAVGHDEGRIEADAELADELRVLLLVAGELLEELGGAGLGDGAEVRDRPPRGSCRCRCRGCVSVPCPASASIQIASSVSPAISSGLASASKRSLSLASEALEISSRRKISRWLYSEWIMSFSSSRTSAWKPRVSLDVAFVLGGCHGAGRLRAPKFRIQAPMRA